MSEKREDLLVIDKNYISPEYNTYSSVEELIERLKKETGFENILLVDKSKMDSQGSINNNPPIFTL